MISKITNPFITEEEGIRILSRVVEQSPNSIVVTDPQGNIEYVNPRFEELSGYTKKELLGQNPRILNSGKNPPLLYRDMWNTILQGKEWRGEFCNKKKSGELFWEDSVISGLMNEHNQIVHFIGVKNEITERKEAERKLRESEESYSNQFTLNLAVMLLIDPESGTILDANESALIFYGYTRAKLVSMTLSDINILSFDEIKKNIATVTKNEGQQFELKHRLSDDSIRDVEVFVSRIQFGGREILHSIIHDITERKEAEKELQETLIKLRKSLSGTIHVISEMINMRDPYTAKHQQNVSKLARKIAQAMNLPAQQVEEIRIAALIHDIGKIIIPAEILSKPTKLSTPELFLVRGHAQSGFDALQNSELPENIKQAIYQHHERLDGSGYPQGLCGDEICLEAKILAVADVIDAMESHRPYRPSLGIDAALVEIVNNKGRLYDSGIVDICFKLLMKEKTKLSKND
jgi:PAS domain S-box-containing protein/putative nucleotidyltransferase with HDIG domain